MSDRPLRVLCWEGYDHPSMTVPFAERAHVAVDARTHVSDHETARRVRAEVGLTDVININNAFAVKHLHPAGLIEALDEALFEASFADRLPEFERLYRWTRSGDGASLIGVAQRFGAFNLVVDTRAVSATRAEDEGFSLAEDRTLPYGLLAYEDFNIFHICIAAGIDPFKPLDARALERFSDTARRWYRRAAIVTRDHHELNRALVERRIAFYLSGGVYTASPARLAGHSEIRAITPRSGPIDGRGGIVFTEITSVLRRPDPHPAAVDYLRYLLEPETAVRIAFIDGTCNPVAQMGNPRVFSAFRSEQLDAIQWDTLEEDISRSADYDIVPDQPELLARLRSAANARPGPAPVQAVPRPRSSTSAAR